MPLAIKLAAIVLLLLFAALLLIAATMAFDLNGRQVDRVGVGIAIGVVGLSAVLLWQ